MNPLVKTVIFFFPLAALWTITYLCLLLFSIIFYIVSLFLAPTKTYNYFVELENFRKIQLKPEEEQ